MAQTQARTVPLEFLIALGTGYSRALTSHPLLVKSITSGIIAALGNLAAQRIGSKKVKKSENSENEDRTQLKLRSVLAYAIYGSFVAAPLLHLFLNWLEAHGPSNPILKVIFDRFGFGPIILGISLYVLPRLEGSKHSDAVAQLKKLYFSAMLMSFRIWIPFQVINLNYVPLKYRVLGVNMVAFLWNIYLSKARSSAPVGKDAGTEKDKSLKED